uniref:Uncharacterized protein n=1 Tax=Anguilla anguilla TaxID=7936 RepID=A0A0E9REP1_ANGAN
MSVRPDYLLSCFITLLIPSVFLSVTLPHTTHLLLEESELSHKVFVSVISVFQAITFTTRWRKQKNRKKQLGGSLPVIGQWVGHVIKFESWVSSP